MRKMRAAMQGFGAKNLRRGLKSSTLCERRAGGEEKWEGSAEAGGEPEPDRSIEPGEDTESRKIVSIGGVAALIFGGVLLNLLRYGTR